MQFDQGRPCSIAPHHILAASGARKRVILWSSLLGALLHLDDEDTSLHCVDQDVTALEKRVA